MLDPETCKIWEHNDIVISRNYQCSRYVVRMECIIGIEADCPLRRELRESCISRSACATVSAFNDNLNIW